MKVLQTYPLKTGFDTERLRKKLLAQKKYSQLLTTYFQKLPEIADANSPDFWDEKFENETDTELFYMTTDRNTIVASEIQKMYEYKNSNHNKQTDKKYLVLNVGAGSGQLEKIVAQKLGKNSSWTGTDFTNKTLNKLKKNFPQFSFVKTKIVPLPFADETFNTVCLLEVLEHIQPSQTFAVLKELSRVTKTGGTVIVSVPINEGLEQMMPSNPNSHVRVYSQSLLEFELQVSGFEVKKIIKLTAFAKYYTAKKIVNSLFNLRKPNNLIFILEKK